MTHPPVVDHRMAVDQQIAKSDDLPYVGHSEPPKSKKAAPKGGVLKPRQIRGIFGCGDRI